MKKFLLSFMALSFLAGSAFATQVEVTMNAKSKLIKSLVNTTTNETVEVGEPTSNKYTFDAPDGTYLLTATAADGETVSGTIQLDIDADHTAFAICSPEVRVKNTGWVYGPDYTFNLKVTTKEGAVVNTTLGDYTSGNKMFLVFSGNTYYLDLVPSETHLAEGYLAVTYTGTVTANPTIQAEAPMSDSFSITVLAGADLFLGTKTAHFVKFKEVAPESVTTEGSTKVYTFKLADKQQYNYRVTQPGKLTQAGIFTMSVDETKRPVLDFTDIDKPGWEPNLIDYTVESNDGYNVSDIFLNINERGHLHLANVGDTYDILPMRNWELIDGITSNYFIEPDFHFYVLNLNGEADNSVVKVENEKLTAVGNGTAIVLVTYDAIHLDLFSGAEKKSFVGGDIWSSIWRENTGAFVVTVGEEATGITPNITINKDYLTTVTPWGGGDPIDTKLSMENVDAEFDVFYYLYNEGGFDYTFTPEGVTSVTLARPDVSESPARYKGFSEEGVTKNADGSYTLRLTEGRNIVCLTNAAGQSVYQVMTAKFCFRHITVNGEEVTTVKPGDEVTVQYSNLYHPAGKLAGIHNFSAFLDYKQATEGITVTKSKANQYKFASTPAAQAVTFTVPEDFTGNEIVLSDGVLGISGFGDPVGNHRATSKDTGRAPNFTAISQSAVFGRVPTVTIPVGEATTLAVADFENLEVPADGHISVSTEEDDERTEFVSGDFEFATGCMSDWDYWYFFGYANRTETKYETLNDQWNNVVGGGYDGSANYGVAYAAAFNGPCTVSVLNHEDGAVVPGFYITNSSYAYNSLTGGDPYAKKFGLGDWFKLTITGYDAAGEVTGTKDYYLADLRDKATAYIINDWRYVDLSGLGKVSKLNFELSSTDNGDWGMNTPAYFCFDNFGAEGEEVLPVKNVVFPLEVATFEELEVPADGHISVSTEEDDERTSFTSGDFEFASSCMSDWDYWYFFGYANRTDTKYETLHDQWNNVVGGGYDGSANYGVAYAAAFNGPCYVTVLSDEPAQVPGFYITNSAYAYYSITGGDQFAKKFGEGDWFLLTITGYDANDEVTGTKEYYLADLRDADKAYIINDWRYVDLSPLGKVKKIGFDLSSTDNGDYGMNTPAYFCFDDFGAEGVEVLPESNVTTGIKEIDNSKSSNSNWYDLQGRRVAQPTRGLYIINGKKVIR